MYASLSLSKKVITTLALSLLMVGSAVFYGLQKNTTELDRALELKSLANQSMVLVLLQLDATKSLLLDPEKLDSISKKKTESYDENQKVFEAMKKSTESIDLRNAISDLKATEDNEMRPLEVKILETLFESPEAARVIYFQQYQPIMTKYENQVRNVVKDADNEAMMRVNEGRRRLIYLFLTACAVALPFSCYLLFQVTGRIKLLLTRMQEAAKSTEHASEQLGSTSKNVTRSVEYQVTELQKITASMAQVTAILEETSESVVNASVYSKTVLGKTEEGRAMIKEVARSISVVSTTSGQLTDLQKIIEEIAVKTGVINDIVFKTQLLSFNASIEAARAGQHGRGFAVVAEEVGNLAVMSGKAADEIRSMLASSKLEVERIVVLTSQCVREADIVTQKTMSGFDDIASAIGTISTRINDVSLASKKQNEGVGDTLKALRAIQNHAHSNNSSAQENLKVAENVHFQALQISKIEQEINVAIFGT